MIGINARLRSLDFKKVFFDENILTNGHTDNYVLLILILNYKTFSFLSLTVQPPCMFGWEMKR